METNFCPTDAQLLLPRDIFSAEHTVSEVIEQRRQNPIKWKTLPLLILP